MQTILLAEPQIDVVLGADTVVLGALAAMRDAGRARADQFFGGIDGEPAAVAELALPDSPYKTRVSLPPTGSRARASRGPSTSSRCR